MLDLAQGYYQNKLTSEEQAKTVFVTPYSKYQYRRFPIKLAKSLSYLFPEAYQHNNQGLKIFALYKFI